MCLTGVDYFSTLGYQPGIAFLAAGLVSPIATSIVVFLTLFGLVPLYSRVASESPHGQGSIVMLERLLAGWRGKTVVLVLLGFAATAWVITITLSAADATAHIIANPLMPSFPESRTIITCLILAVLGGVFLKGFREAIGMSVALVAFYLICNSAVIIKTAAEIFAHPETIQNWQSALINKYQHLPAMIGFALTVFPKLALGMSGFETGVAVMPLVKGDDGEDPQHPTGRIKNTAKLLVVAALIMAVLLLSSSVVTTLLIPPEHFDEGGPANGRALSYLAHEYLGEVFGTVYDISTILILWFAGASAMAGLLNLVPRYLPRYGMAPEWARAQRPLVIFFTMICFAVTIVFKADVDAQAGAYATGVLVLFMSAALAVLLAVWHESLLKRIVFGLIFCVFVYTSIVNMSKQPEGLQIATIFIAAILVISLVSRALRSLELRTLDVRMDANAERFVREAVSRNGQIYLLAHRPDSEDYALKEAQTREVHKLTESEATFIFLEVTLTDPSNFGDEYLEVAGYEVDGFLVLKLESPAIPNAIAALLLHLRNTTGTIPHVYFGWTEGHPLSYVFKYIFLGEGETAPVTREILRKLEADPDSRPRIIVG